MANSMMHEALIAAAVARGYDPDAIVVVCRRHPLSGPGSVAFGPFPTEKAAWGFHLRHVTYHHDAVRCCFNGTSDDHAVTQIGFLGTPPARLIDPAEAG